MKAVPYRKLVGKLLYLAVATRPDIAYVVGVLCRFVENPGEAHWNAAKRVLRYLKGTVDMSLACSGSSSPNSSQHSPTPIWVEIRTTAVLRVLSV